jgi:hypothetical protein
VAVRVSGGAQGQDPGGPDARVDAGHAQDALGYVAGVAGEAAHNAGLVVVVDRQDFALSRRAKAEKADATLVGEPALVLGQGDAVPGQQLPAADGDLVRRVALPASVRRHRLVAA